MHGKSRARGYLKLQTISSMFHEHRLNNIVRDNAVRASLRVRKPSCRQCSAGVVPSANEQSKNTQRSSWKAVNVIKYAAENRISLLHVHLSYISNDGHQ